MKLPLFLLLIMMFCIPLTAQESAGEGEIPAEAGLDDGTEAPEAPVMEAELSAPEEPAAVPEADAPAAEEYSYDFFLSRLNALEEAAALQGTLSEEERAEIELLREQLEGTDFGDLQNEAEFLAILAEKDSARTARESEAAERLSLLREEETRYRKTVRTREKIDFWQKFTLKAAAAGLVSYGAFELLGNKAYDNYLYADNLNDAYEYQVKWEMYDAGSAASLGFCLLNLAAWAVLSGIEQKNP